MFPIPKRVFLTRGVGVRRQQLSAFEYALRDADIEQQNLVSVSSILPPQCELIPRSAGIEALSPGRDNILRDGSCRDQRTGTMDQRRNWSRPADEFRALWLCLGASRLR